MKNLPKTHQVENSRKRKKSTKKENLRKKQIKGEYRQINQPFFWPISQLLNHSSTPQLVNEFCSTRSFYQQFWF